MDFKSLDLELATDNGVTCKVVHPVTMKPLKGVEIRLYGIESRPFKAASKKARAAMGGKEIDANSEEFQEQMTEILIECLIDWTGIEWEGKPLEFNKKNARMLLTNEGFSWLNKQLLAAAGDLTLVPLGKGSP